MSYEFPGTVACLNCGSISVAVPPGSAKYVEVEQLIARLVAAERVIEAARRRFDVWTRDTYSDLRSAFAAYDAAIAKLGAGDTQTTVRR